MDFSLVFCVVLFNDVERNCVAIFFAAVTYFWIFWHGYFC